MTQASAQEDSKKKMSKTVSVHMPNVRGVGEVTLALEPDETTVKVSIGGSTACEVFVRASDLIEAARLFEAAGGTSALRG